MREFSKKAFHRAILSQYVEYLKKQSPHAYADHLSLWNDFGWDICNGDGRVEEMARDYLLLGLLENDIQKLPKQVYELLWWETFDGNYSKGEILEALEQGEPIAELEKYEVNEAIVEDLYATFREWAENEYEQWKDKQYEESECSDDEDCFDDEEEEDDDEEDEEEDEENK